MRPGVELVKQAYEEVAARKDIEAALDYYTEDSEWVMRGPWIEEPVYRGHDGLRRFFDTWFNTFTEQEFLTDRFEYVEKGDRIVVLAWQRVSAGGSELVQEFGHVCEFRDGKISRSDIYPTHRAALEAAGAG